MMRKNFDDDLECVFFQITEGLTFLHNDVKLVHSSICPESILINKSGSWKLSGFDFCLLNSNQPDQPVSGVTLTQFWWNYHAFINTNQNIISSFWVEKLQNIKIVCLICMNLGQV